MITANELRIGNTLQYYIGEDGCEWDNTNIDAQDILWAHDKNENFNQVHKPISLSPEILERYGFRLAQDDGDMQYYQKPGESHGYGVMFDHEDFAFYGFRGEVVDVLIHDRPCFQYLHHLQNVIHALTGTELTQAPEPQK